MKKIYFILILLIMLFGINVKAEELTENQKAVIEVAYAFHNRGGNIQYDSSYLTYNKNFRRGNNPFSPEDATDDYLKYRVCSSYVNNIYYEAFSDSDDNPYLVGNNKNGATFYMTQYANPNNAEYYDEDIAILYIENPSVSDTDTRSVDSEKRLQSKQQILDNIKPGDIIVYYLNSKSGGHAMMYLGDDLVIQSSSASPLEHGGTYNFTEKTDGKEFYGTTSIISLSNNVLASDPNFLTSDGFRLNKYVLSTAVTKLAILRPLNSIEKNNYKITDMTKMRLAYPSLVINKTASKKKYDSVSLGEEITYKVKLENKSNIDYNELTITDAVPSKTTLVSTNGSVDGDILEYKVTLRSGEEATFEYTVKVDNDENNYGMYIENVNTKVNGNLINQIYTYVGKSLSNDDISFMKNKISENKQYENVSDLMNDLYSNLNIKFGDIDSIISTLFTLNSNDNKVDYVLGRGDNDYDKMFVEGLFGGRYTYDSYDYIFNTNLRTTEGRIDYFTDGDILIVNDESLKNMYLFMDNSFVTLDNNNIKTLTDTETNALLDSLVGQDNFITLRPSFVKKDVNSIDSDYLTVQVPFTKKNVAVIYIIVSLCIIMISISTIVYLVSNNSFFRKSTSK